MIRLILTVGLLLPTLLSVAFWTPAAMACSGDSDAVEVSDVIVGGRITGWTKHPPPTPEPGPKPFVSPFTTITVHMDVAETFKGQAGVSFDFVDTGSLMERPDGIFWAGSSGACGAFDDDPTGRYAILGLLRSVDGNYYDSLPLTFYLDGEPSGTAHERAVSFLSSRGLQALPSGGGLPGGARSSADLAAGVMAVIVGSSMMFTALRFGRKPS